MKKNREMSEEDLMHMKADVGISTGNFSNEAEASFAKRTPEEESNSLLSTSIHSSIDQSEIISEMKYFDTNESLSEDTLDANNDDKILLTSTKKRNLYPNVLISPSRDQSDIDTDEEDFQLRASSNHKRNDSGQGSSITDNCSELKKIDLNDDENHQDSEEHSEEGNCVNAKVCTKGAAKPDDASFTPVIPKTPELDVNLTDVLSKFQEGSEEVLSKARTNSILNVKNAMNDSATNSAFDETDFTDIPLDSPGNKSHMNTYAPRVAACNDSEGQIVSGDLKKPAITDTKRKSALR